MASPVDVSALNTVADYDALIEWVDDVKTRSVDQWAELVQWLSQQDLFFLHRYVLTLGKAIHRPTGKPLYHSQLHIDLCKNTQYQFSVGQGLCSSSRRSGKSEIRSCAFPIWVLINNPDAAICIYSVEKSLALRHLDRCRFEMEKNELLKFLHPDVMWEDPTTEAKSNSLMWNRMDGLVVKGRKVNRPNASISANAFWTSSVGSGFEILLLDDCQRRDTVDTQEGVDKLDTAFSEAISLLTPSALDKPVIMMQNTRFSTIDLVTRKFDEWSAIDPRMAFEVPAEIIEERHDDCMKYVWEEGGLGPLGGPVTWPHYGPHLQQRYSAMTNRSEYLYQFCLSSRSTEESALDENKIHFYQETPAEMGRGLNIYIGIDPSKGKRDPSAMWVWGLTHDKRAVWLDAIISRLDVTSQEFHDALFGLVSKWSNIAHVMEVRVEDTANSDWAGLIDRELRSRFCWVTVAKCVVHANQSNDKYRNGKASRIWSRWSPALNRGDIWAPQPVSKGGRGILCDMNRDGQYKDLVDYMLSVEIRPFPSGKHDDGLDAAAQLWHERRNAEAPLIYPSSPPGQDSSQSGRMYANARKGSWMSAG